MMITTISSLLSLTFLFLATQVTSTSFGFASLSQNSQQIELEQDAYLSSKGLELTKNDANGGLNGSYGRASFNQPIQLWDPKTLNLTDFLTHFTFSIHRASNRTSGDGMTFFLAPFDSKIANYSDGEYLGLISWPDSENSTGNATVVAVEFDTFQNLYDPSPNHVGIDVYSIVSVTNFSWTNGRMDDGRKANAWVRYDSASLNLSVFLTYDENPVFSDKYSILSYVVDLRDYLPDKVRVGFTASTGKAVETHTVFSWSFNSTMDLISNTTVEAPSPSTIVEAVKLSQGKGKIGLVIGLVVGFFVFFVLVAGVVWWKRKSSGREIEEEEEEHDVSIENEFESGSGPKRFAYSELREATRDFSEEGKLGEGGFGGVYKGILLKSGLEIAVKKISKASKQGQKEYISEVKIISRLRHRNLVQLIGWCHKRGEFLLIYELLPNGSLDSHLFGRKSSMSWGTRHKIALGLASALLYLHEEWEQCVVHRDIKSSNVMLDANFNAKLGDFGLARLVDHNYSLHTVAFAGTMGYIAPECLETGQSSKESDVYSFGVVALEISCGRRAVEVNSHEVKLVNWVWKLYEKGVLVEGVDERLGSEFDVKEIECLMAVGLWCCHPDPSFRPSMRQAMSVLKFEAELPGDLPRELPRPMYGVRSSDSKVDYCSSSFVVTGSSVASSSTSNSETSSKPLLKI